VLVFRELAELAELGDGSGGVEHAAIVKRDRGVW
jgi:hypothetical protein